MPNAAITAKETKPEERIESQQIGAGRAGERAVGNRVRGKRRTAKHHEETHGAGQHGDDRAADPRVGHEAREHFSAPSPVAQRTVCGAAGRFLSSDTLNHTRDHELEHDQTTTTKKLTGRPRCDENQ
jgi:hypothetical protein